MPAFSGPELCALNATEVVDLLRRGEVSPTELVEASLTRIAEVEPSVNAVVTVCPDRARKAAADWAGGEPDAPGWLGGLPIAIKDLTPVAGVRMTMGTPGLADHVPDHSDPLVLRLEARGGIVMGKTNTPEMGAGGNTFNAVFGMTRNPWNTALNAGGSSGGSAVALATGEVWLAHGSDLAGSLRTPAAYCGVVGLRPSPGIAGGGPAMLGFHTAGVQGPMARNIEDCALFLDAMAGFDPVWPISHPAPNTPYLSAARAPVPAPRIAYSPDLGGFASTSPVIDAALRSALSRAERSGATIEMACPDLTGLEPAYLVQRAMLWGAGPGRMPGDIQAQFKKTLHENIRFARDLTIEEVFTSDLLRTTLYHNMRQFLSTHDVLACPVIGVEAGPVEEEFPRNFDGGEFGSYVDWLRFSFLSVATGLPSLSMPAGRTPGGMPVGLQLIGPPRGEARLLAVAKMLEGAFGIDATPIDPVTRA